MHSVWQNLRYGLRGLPNEPLLTALGVFAILVLTLATLPAFAGAADNAGQLSWPQFRGPNSSGIGDGKPPVEFGPDKNVLWKVAIGSGLSSPVIAKGRLFLTEFDRNTKQLSTVCIDPRTGKTLWRRSVAPAQIEKVHEIGSPAAPTPATDGERVYAYFGSYGLVSYDFDGKVQWERRLPLPENIYGAVSSPIVAGHLLVLNHQGKEAYLLGVDRRDGRTVWKTDRSQYQYGWSTPVYWRHDGVDEIAVLGGDFQPNQRLMAYNLADGTERWWVAGLPPCGKSTPVIGGGLLFFAAPDIIMEPAAEKANPERAAQMYANNASRVVAGRPARGDPNSHRMVGAQGRTRCSLASLQPRTSLYIPERRHRFRSKCADRRAGIQRTHGGAGILLLVARGGRQQDLHRIRRRRCGGPRCRRAIERAGWKQTGWRHSGHTSDCRRETLRTNRKRLVCIRSTGRPLTPRSNAATLLGAPCGFSRSRRGVRGGWRRPPECVTPAHCARIRRACSGRDGRLPACGLRPRFLARLAGSRRGATVASTVNPPEERHRRAPPLRTDAARRLSRTAMIARSRSPFGGRDVRCVQERRRPLEGEPIPREHARNRDGVIRERSEMPVPDTG